MRQTIDFAFDNEISFIPVEYKSKKPLIQWKEYQKRRPSSKESDNWFKNKIDINIGLICGSISGGVGKNLVVPDYDDEELFHKFHANEKYFTRVAKTPNGYHEYFFLPEPCRGSTFEIEKNNGTIGRIDIKAEGGYVIAPPSVHPSREKYKWLNKMPIQYLPDYTAERFIETFSNKIQMICDKEGWIFKNKKNFKKEVDLYDKYWDGSKPDCGLVAKRLIEDYHLKTLMDTDEILYYDNCNGLYHYHGEKIIIRDLQIDRFGGDGITRYFQNEIINKIRGITFFKRMVLNSKPNLIHMKNGIFHLDSWELMPFNPKVISTIGIPVHYDPNADCPKIKKFFKEVVPEDSVIKLEEIIGDCLHRENIFQKATMLLGPGGNGKTTLINLIVSLLGEGNYSAIPLRSLDTDRFASSGLEGKLANLVADIPDKALHETGVFKSVTGNDPIPAQKKFKDSYSFIPFASHVYSCNKLPESRDYSPAFFRRWNIITFPNSFYGNDADKNLKNELTTEGELSGLFNLAINGLKRLLKNGEFSHSASVQEVETRWTWLSDSLKAFCNTSIEEKVDSYITTEGFYDRYLEFCKDNGLLIKAKNIVGMQIGHHLKTEKSRPKINKKKTFVYKGITFKKGEG